MFLRTNLSLQKTSKRPIGKWISMSGSMVCCPPGAVGSWGGGWGGVGWVAQRAVAWVGVGWDGMGWVGAGAGAGAGAGVVWCGAPYALLLIGNRRDVWYMGKMQNGWSLNVIPVFCHAARGSGQWDFCGSLPRALRCGVAWTGAVWGVVD